MNQTAPREKSVRKSPTVAAVRQVMRWVILIVVLAVLVFLGNIMWVNFFGGKSLF
jgi:hypothetical protein